MSWASGSLTCWCGLSMGLGKHLNKSIRVRVCVCVCVVHWMTDRKGMLRYDVSSLSILEEKVRKADQERRAVVSS